LTISFLMQEGDDGWAALALMDAIGDVADILNYQAIAQHAHHDGTPEQPGKLHRVVKTRERRETHKHRGALP
jgi:hypothetical protein